MAMSLGKIYIRDARLLKDPAGLDVFHVRDPHALIQASGYLKFVRGPEQESIFFRGQAKAYRALIPSLFRGAGTSQEGLAKRAHRRTLLIQEIFAKAKILSTFSRFAHEPLLQHYGIHTTWIDLVDNIWVALWFACHRAHVSGKQNQYMHLERRNPHSGSDEFAYILLVAADSTPVAGVPGLYKGPNTELVDLRVACPSIFLRPHAQHGVLFRKRGAGTMRPNDYADQIRGIIRMSLADALSWLGDAKTLNVHTLFPPPYYDKGYDFLLDTKIETDGHVGSISIVGA
jgi:hypothetical protein